MRHPRRSFFRALAIGLAWATDRAGAQGSGRIPRVALVFSAAPLAEMAGVEPVHPSVRAFVHALRDLGLVEGRNVVIERRSAEGQGAERMAALMREVVELAVDVIVTTRTGVAAAQRATDRIAIVAIVDTILDTGLVESLARPGRNVTGIGFNSAEGYGKELQLLKEAAPTITRVAVLADRPSPGQRESWRVEIDTAARRLGIDVVWLIVDSIDDIGAAFVAIDRERADAINVVSASLDAAHRRRIAAFALDRRLPSIGTPQDGMLLVYTADLDEVMRRVARQVQKILQGAKAGDLPFESPTSFRLVLNLKTARALGLAIPPSLLLRADEVIR